VSRSRNTPVNTLSVAGSRLVHAQSSSSHAVGKQTSGNDPAVLAGFHACGPGCWGPVEWMAMHQMLRGFQPTPTRKAALVTHLTSLADVLPCSACGNHWRTIAPTVDTSSRDAALKWSIDAHNSVNERLGKPKLSYAQAIAAMDALQSSLRSGAGLGPAFQSARLAATDPSSSTTLPVHTPTPGTDKQVLALGLSTHQTLEAPATCSTNVKAMITDLVAIDPATGTPVTCATPASFHTQYIICLAFTVALAVLFLVFLYLFLTRRGRNDAPSRLASITQMTADAASIAGTASTS
jgi:hypothetical protein